MRKKSLLIPLALLLAISLVAIGCPTTPETTVPPTTTAPTTPTEPVAPELITARFSGWALPPTIPGQVETHFFDLLHEKVGDRIQVEVFQGGTLYKYQEEQLPLKTGAVEIIDLTTITLNEWVPDFKVVFLTGAWDVDELMTYMSSPDFEGTWDKMLDSVNCIPLGPHPGGTFYFWSTQPLSSTADFKGLRLQSANFKQIDIVKAFGGSGGALQVFDIYTALQQGQYDACLGTPSIVLGFGWAEFLKYKGAQPWAHSINYFLVNKDFWDSLPPDVQQAFEETGEETTQWALAMFDGAEAAQLAALEEQWDLQYFTISDWENVMAVAETAVWPETREEVGAELFDSALQYAGLAD